MERDLKWIKKHYGEEMMHLCRSLFPKILETEGLLSSILQQHFKNNKFLARDIKNQYKEEEFKNYIYSFIDVEDNETKIKTQKSAVELLDEAGYILYPECKTEADIQSFRHYYDRKENGPTPVYTGGKPETYRGEELCTFNGGRLKSCRVWFAVKKDVDKITSKANPKREDEYGTSVISIQFSKGPSSTLSIKNRYNHSVNNPDNTFNSDLDNIIDGLSDAFEKDYGVRDTIMRKSLFELDGYVCINGINYKYNHELNTIYYCDNNTVISNYKEKKLPEHMMLVDYFVFDFKNNKVQLIDESLRDSFVDCIGPIKNMSYKDGLITIERINGEPIKIGINEERQMISLSAPDLKNCGENFLYFNKTIKSIDLPSLETCGDSFLMSNKCITELNLPKLESCEGRFLSGNSILTNLNLPKLKSCGGVFLGGNRALKTLNLPSLECCWANFMHNNMVLKDVNLPKLKKCGVNFLPLAQGLEEVTLPSLKECGNGFLQRAYNVRKVNLPSLETCGDDFMYQCGSVYTVNMPKLEICGKNFMRYNEIIEELSLPRLEIIGDCFLRENTTLKKLNVPNLNNAREDFLYKNQCLTELNVQSLLRCYKNFLHDNNTLKTLYVPTMTDCDNNLLYSNNSLVEFIAPKMASCGVNCLYNNTTLQQVKAPRLKYRRDGFLENHPMNGKIKLPKRERDDIIIR